MCGCDQPQRATQDAVSNPAGGGSSRSAPASPLEMPSPAMHWSLQLCCVDEEGTFYNAFVFQAVKPRAHLLQGKHDATLTS